MAAPAHAGLHKRPLRTLACAPRSRLPGGTEPAPRGWGIEGPTSAAPPGHAVTSPTPGALLVLVRRRELLSVEPGEAARLYAEQGGTCSACGRP